MIATLLRLDALAPVSRRRLTLTVLFGALAVVLGVGLMASAGWLISKAAEHPPILSLGTTIVLVRFFGLSRPIARYIDRLVSHDLTLRALGRLRARFYERIEPLAPAELEGFRRGDLLARMVADVDRLQDLLLRGLLPPLVAVAAATVCVAATALLLPAAALVLAGGLIAGGIVAPLVAAAVAGASGRRQVEARAGLTAELLDSLRGAPELVMLGRERQAVDGVRAADRELNRLARRDSLAAGVAEWLSILIAGVTAAGVLVVAVNAEEAGGLDRVLVGVLAMFALASFESVTPLPEAGRVRQGALAAGRRVLELCDREPEVADPGTPAPLPDGPAPVALEGVWARYRESSNPVLCGFDLRIDPGARVALVGPSGSGKSTVAALLVRFLDPFRGRVTIGERDIRELAQADVRRTVALAEQDGHLFNSSIRENLRIGRPGATDAELFAVLDRVRMGAWARSLAAGLDTVVGEEGMRLSGGERARIVIARALLADAPLLVLDEPTAHLDGPTAEGLLADALAAAGDRSVLLITHRPEGLDLVDEVVRLGPTGRAESRP